jgi:hypothetical protein
MPTRIMLNPTSCCKPMQRSRQEDKFIDISLLVGERTIPAHRAVLVGLSPYLDGLLTSGLAECREGGYEVRIGDAAGLDGRAVEAVVDSFYSGELELSADTVASIICAANLLGVDAAEHAACDYFVESLEPYSACEALVFAAAYAEGGGQVRLLHGRCLDFAVEHFAECSRERSFLELPCEALAEVIQRDDLPVDEATVLAAVREWYEHDEAGRQRCLQELVRFVRWPLLLPTEARLALPQEPLLLRLINHDPLRGGALVMQLLVELTPQFAQSDAAASCPRLKRRKGIARPVLPLAFTALSRQHYTISEDGSSLTSTDDPIHRPVVCRERVMNSGQSCAEIKVEQTRSGNIMIGVGRPSLDPSAEGAWWREEFWGMESGNGDLCHGYVGRNWQGGDAQEPYGEGDVFRLLLDSDAETLTVKKNGTLLGVMVTGGLAGDLCWAVSCYSEGVSMSIQAVDPADF